jgi:copper oxidase (laccase) domain-containing protein
LGRLYISLGPAIGECCFEVGAEVAILFDENYVTIRNDRYYLNVRRLVKDRLAAMKVSPERITDVAECTSCLPAKYYSFRRDGHARRQMVSFICKK